MTTKLRKLIIDEEDECFEEEYDEKDSDWDDEEDSDWDDEEDEEVELKPLTPEQRVINLLKGGFESRCGISFDEFIKVYNDLLEHSPEKLI